MFKLLISIYFWHVKNLCYKVNGLWKCSVIENLNLTRRKRQIIKYKDVGELEGSYTLKLKYFWSSSRRWWCLWFSYQERLKLRFRWGSPMFRKLQNFGISGWRTSSMSMSAVMVLVIHGKALSYLYFQETNNCVCTYNKYISKT